MKSPGCRWTFLCARRAWTLFQEREQFQRARKFCEELTGSQAASDDEQVGGCGLALISSFRPEPALSAFKLVCQEQSKFLLALVKTSFSFIIYQLCEVANCKISIL